MNCNMCGEEMDQNDVIYNPFAIYVKMGYGTIYDNSILDLHLCHNCQNKLLTYLIENCKINPIITNDANDELLYQAYQDMDDQINEANMFVENYDFKRCMR